MATKAKPVHKIRAGALEAAIWRNDSEKGSFYSVTVSRSYKKGEEWKQADSFSGDDLPMVRKLLDRAHDFIIDNPLKRQAEAA
jgi:hypothetical protein